VGASVWGQKSHASQRIAVSANTTQKNFVILSRVRSIFLKSKLALLAQCQLHQLT
jgi:hypothetical protein